MSQLNIIVFKKYLQYLSIVNSVTHYSKFMQKNRIKKLSRRYINLIYKIVEML